MIFQPTLHYEWITPKRLPPEAKVKATHARKQRNRWHQRLARYLHIKQCFLLIYIQNLFLWLRTRGNIASAAPSATFLSADVQFVGKPPRKVWAKSFHTNLKKINDLECQNRLGNPLNVNQPDKYSPAAGRRNLPGFIWCFFSSSP